MSESELAIKNVHMLVPASSIDAYIKRVNQVPMLTLEEEQELSKLLQEKGDLQAAQKLIMAHLRYVVKVAKGYMGYGLQLSDLIQEGTVGLMKAVKRFQPDRGVRLVSFAVHWIKSEIHEFVLKNWRIVKVATTKAQRKLFFNLKSSKERLGWSSKEEVEAIAKDLGVKPEEVLLMEQRLNSSDMSFDPVVVDSSDDDNAFHPCGYLESSEQDPQISLMQEDWQAQAGEKFEVAFKQLDVRQQDIIKKRWLTEKKVTLKELSKQYEISIERVRQIEEQAIKQLKENIVDTAA